jgi:ligand-binding SRPBCC domain-containing protein
MPHIYELEHKQFVRRPLAEVFGFFADAGNLETITPKALRFHILTPRPIVMQPGTIIEYRLRLMGIPFRWKTLIETFEPMRRFTDSQAKGPYRLWHHTHEFLEQDDGVLIVDRVRYQLPLGILGQLAHMLFVRRQLEGIFEFRRQKIEEVFGNPAIASGEAVQV